MTTPTEVLEAKERPILFSGPMVRALLDGRKTQTRRAVKPMRSQEFLTPELLASAPSAKIVDGWAGFEHPKGGPLTAIRCPYGIPGERLWVRESGLEHKCTRLFIHDAKPGRWWTPKDGGRYGAGYSSGITRQSLLHDHRVRPSIHMPRWACRLVLEITDVRVERLNDCSEADAMAEGTQEPSLVPIIGACWSERDAYAKLWEHINGAGSWAANPWVWAVSFRVLSDEERQASRRGGEA